MAVPGPMVLMLAGEESGDLHGSAVARALKAARPDLRLVGLGGKRMEAAGVQLLATVDELAVMGFAEVLHRLPFFWRLESRLIRLLDREDVGLVIPIDYPGLNLRVARAARKRRIPVLYYIAPQVWAWRPGRARRLARDANRVAVILPFEEEFLRRRGVAATFVGHPLLDQGREVPPREDFARSAGLDPQEPILALFPGSRRQELARHLPLFREAAGLLRQRLPGLQAVVARAPSVPEHELQRAGLSWVEDGWALLCHAQAALVKSGTATLEATLAGTPMVAVYRMDPLTYWLARRLITVPHVALPNLVAGRMVVPEVLQREATPGRLAELLLPLLEGDSPARRHQTAGLAEVRRALGETGGGAAPKVARMAVELLDASPGPARRASPVGGQEHG